MSNLRCARLLKLSVALALAGPGAITVGCGGDGSGGNVGTGRRRGAHVTWPWSWRVAGPWCMLHPWLGSPMACFSCLPRLPMRAQGGTQVFHGGLLS